MIKIKKSFIVGLILLAFISFTFSADDRCRISSDLSISPNNYNCDSIYEVKIGRKNTYCFDPRNKASHEVIPRIRDIPEFDFPHNFLFNELKGSFSKKYGGCNVIYNREKGKLEIQFTQGQVNKFKKYCDKTFEEVGEAQTLLSHALEDMSKLDITKVIDKSNEEKTTIKLSIKNAEEEELGDGDFLLFSVLPKETTPTSKHVDFVIQDLVKVEEDETITTELKYSVRDNDPVIDWHFKNLGDGTITIVCPS